MKIAIFVKLINLQPKLSNSNLSLHGGTDLRPQLASNHKQKLRDFLHLFQKLDWRDIGMEFDTLLGNVVITFMGIIRI